MLIYRGSTDKSVKVRFFDNSTGFAATGLNASTPTIQPWYHQERGVLTTFSAVALASPSGAHEDGGFIHVNDGYYRIDPPDAAFAGVATHVIIGVYASGYQEQAYHAQISDFNPQDSVRMGQTALPNIVFGNTGGLVGYGTSAGQIDTQNGKVYITPSSIAEATNDIFSRSGTIEALYNLRQVCNIFLSALAAEASGATGEASTIYFRDVADTKNRIVADVDEHGNRLSVVLDAD